MGQSGPQTSGVIQSQEVPTYGKPQYPVYKNVLPAAHTVPKLPSNRVWLLN